MTTQNARDVIKHCITCKKTYDDCTKPFCCSKSYEGTFEGSEWNCADCTPAYIGVLAMKEEMNL